MTRTRLFLIVLVYAAATAPLQPRQGAGSPLGHPQVTVPFKGALQRCDHNHEAMLVQSVDTTLLDTCMYSALRGWKSIAGSFVGHFLGAESRSAGVAGA